MLTGKVQNEDGGERLVRPTERVLVTGAAGFIGLKVIEGLVSQGFRTIRCFVRNAGDSRLQQLISKCRSEAAIEVFSGDLLSPEHCLKATEDVAVVYHLAVSTGGKSFADAFMNSVLTTRNLLDGCLQNSCLKRFVNVSSFALYTNRNNPRGRIVDESSPVEDDAMGRGDAYCFAKLKQDEIVIDYGRRYKLPYVIVRPGVVYGPGKSGLVGRVGIGTFGVFLHLGGPNLIPLTYVSNCADAIILAGVRSGIDSEVFNVVDDDLVSSRKILRMYKKSVKRLPSIYLPHTLSYLLSCLWEGYSRWSQGQVPLTFNRKAWHAYWRGARYSNEKSKRILGWTPRVSTAEGLRLYLDGCRKEERCA